MAQLNLYKPNGDWCFRIIRPIDGGVMAAASGLVALDTALAASTVALTYSTVIHGFPISVPTALVAGEYDLVLYNVAANAIAADTPAYNGRRFKWNGRGSMYAFDQKLFSL